MNPEIKKFWEDAGWQISSWQISSMSSLNKRVWHKHDPLLGFNNHQIIARSNDMFEIEYFFNNKIYSEKEMLRIIRLKVFC